MLLEENDSSFKQKILNCEKIEKQEILRRFQIKPRYAHFRKFHQLLSSKKNLDNTSIIDQGILVYFPEGKSFTGEDIVEFHIHGSKAVQTKFLMELNEIKQFRMAEQVH